MPNLSIKNKRKASLFLFFSVVCVGGVAILVNLGLWQWGRMADKQAILAETETLERKTGVGTRHPDVSLQEVLTWPLDDRLRYPYVRAEGLFDHSRDVLLESQMNRGGNTAGYRLFTPLLLEDGKEIYVDRGWIPREFQPGGLQRYKTTGLHFVEGQLKLPAPTAEQHVSPAKSAAGAWLYIRPAVEVFPKKQGVARLDVYLQAHHVDSRTTEGRSESKPQSFIPPAVAITPERHRHYSFTWFGIAFVWAICCGVYVRSVWRELP